MSCSGMGVNASRCGMSVSSNRVGDVVTVDEVFLKVTVLLDILVHFWWKSMQLFEVDFSHKLEVTSKKRFEAALEMKSV